MEKVDIRITKARIISYMITLEENFPEVAATIGLYTEDDKKVTSYSISSASWRSERFDVPVQMIESIKMIGRELEAIVAKQANREALLLT